MKFVKWLTFIIIPLFSACSKETVQLYDVSMEAQFDIPVGLNTIETHYFILRDIPTFYKQSADVHSLDTSKINNVVASKGLMRGSFQNADYDFISRVSIYAVSKKNPSLKREMYYLDFVPLGTDEELRMLSSSTALKDILKEEFIDLEVRLNFRNFPGSNLRTKIVFGYAIF